MPTPPAVIKANAIVCMLVLAAVLVGAVAVLRLDVWGDRGGASLGSLDLDLQKLTKIDPELIRYGQTGTIPTGMQQVRALAVGPDDRIYVGGDRGVRPFAPDGTGGSQIALDGQPVCLAVASTEHEFPGRLYVGLADHVEVYDATGTRQAVWDRLGERSILTSVATCEEDVFVADAGARIVARYDTSGKLLGKIGAPDPKRNIPGFAIPSPYFDVAVAPDGLLRVVNPGALRIEAYTFAGDLELHWGKAASTIEGFFGCCNPAHLALFADGRVVTAEKGIPRVKTYSAAGEFLGMVAGPEQLELQPGETIEDVATDGQGRVLVLDPKAASVRIFERREGPEPGEQP